MGPIYTMLALPLSVSPIVGALQLQAPALEYYYSREAGFVTQQPALSLGDSVTRGQNLLTYQVSGRMPGSVLSRTSGHIDYVNNDLAIGYNFIVGEMLYRIRSNKVLGRYTVDNNPLSKLSVNSTLWVCTQDKQWQFNVDLIQSDHLLLSSYIAHGDYDKLLTLSQKDRVDMYSSKEECLTLGSTANNQPKYPQL